MYCLLAHTSMILTGGKRLRRVGCMIGVDYADVALLPLPCLAFHSTIFIWVARAAAEKVY